jgi:hypothetical protein
MAMTAIAKLLQFGMQASIVFASAKSQIGCRWPSPKW